MSIENNAEIQIEAPVEPSLDDFSDEFFGREPQKPEEPASSEEVVVEEDAPTEDTHDDEVEEDLEEEVVEAKPKKNRFQERVDELTGKYRDAERRAEALEARLNDTIAKLTKESEPAKVAPTTNGPTPDDLNDAGEAKYPLGEFDANYIRDLTRHTLKAEAEVIRAEEAERTAQAQKQQEMQVLQSEWSSKVASAQERYPDFVEKGQALLSQFGSLDKAYGDYLGETIMSMEYGADVLNYLASNPQAAHDIVKLGTTKATIALGRIEGQFADAAERKKAQPKVTKAPQPPEFRNKGATASLPEVADDTDDLDAFAAKLFKKR